MNDFRKCLKLIKYIKMPKFVIGTSIAFMAMGLLLMVGVLADAASENIQPETRRIVSEVNLPVYMMFMGTLLPFSSISSLFCTPYFSASPLRRYGMTKLLPVSFFLCGTVINVIAAVLGLLFCIGDPFAGTVTAAAMMTGALFYGITEVWSSFYLKYPWTMVLLFVMFFSYIRSAESIIGLVTNNFTGTAAVFVGFGSAQLISGIFFLIAYAVNLLLYKKPYAKIWTKYQKMT